MAAPTLVTVRSRVTLAPDAAASFRRVERELGREMDVNRTYSDYDTQLRMWKAWNLYAAGKGPHPGHSRALHPDDSIHCRGLALDSDDWATPGFVDLMARHGWIRTAANDPTERHHFEYQWRRNQHRNDPAPIPSAPTIKQLLEDTMANPIIDVKTTLWIGRDDGEFEQYETWKAENSRGIISKVFYGGTGTNDLIPTLSEKDFQVAKTVWRQMRKGGKA